MALSNIANDYSNYCDINLKDKLDPICKCVDDMLTRLEEFQTMISFVHQDRDESNKVLISVLDATEKFHELCRKIDNVEGLVSHIKNNLNTLEEEINKKEERLSPSEPSSLKMSNIFTPFTPLFKKSTSSSSLDQKGGKTANLEMFKTEDYFN